MHTQNDIHKISTASPLVYNNMGVTRGRLPQRAGSLGLNGGGAAAVVPPQSVSLSVCLSVCHNPVLYQDSLTFRRFRRIFSSPDGSNILVF